MTAEGLWMPGKKLISIPKPRQIGVFTVYFTVKGLKSDSSNFVRVFEGDWEKVSDSSEILGMTGLSATSRTFEFDYDYA